MRDGEVVRIREGNKWKPARVTQVLPSPRSYKVETERGEYRRNRRHLLRTEESQIPEITPTPEVSIDEDLTDTKVEPSSIIVAHENPVSVTLPTGMSIWLLPRGLVGQSENCRDLKTMLSIRYKADTAAFHLSFLFSVFNKRHIALLAA